MSGPVRSPRGLLRRALAEVVPGLVGASAAWLAWPLAGGVVSVAAGLAVWAALSRTLALLVRPRPWRLRLYRLAVLAHVLFWSVQGVRDGELRPPGPVELAPRAAATGLATFRAGVGEAPFALERAPLAGYGGGARRRAVPALGGLGPVGRLARRLMAPSGEAPPRAPMLAWAEGEGAATGARALVLLPDGEGGVPLAFVRLDLVVPDETLVARIRGEARRLGIPEAACLVAASHTHSGPGGFHCAELAQLAGTDFFQGAIADRLLAAAEEALRAAVAAARPATACVVAARDRGADGRPVLARNRRLPDPDAIDDRVLALRLDAADGGAPIALLLNYAVHPTFLGPEHAAFDRDVAGAVEEALSARLPGRPPVLLLQGALADVAPRKGSDASPGAALALAEAFAAAVAGDLAGGRPRAHLRVRAALARRDLGSPHALEAWGSRRAFDRDVAPSAFGGGPAQVAAGVLALPLNALPWSLGATPVRVGFTFDGAAGAMVNLDGLVPTRTHAFGALVLDLADGSDGAGAERHAMLWLPGEATQALGKRWRARAEGLGLPAPFLLGLVNGSIAYVTSEEEYDRSGAYEARATLFGSRAAALVEESLFAALDAARDGEP